MPSYKLSFMSELFESDYPNALESFADRELAVIHRMFDETPELQHDLADYQVLIPSLPAEDATLCGDALRQIDIAEVEGDQAGQVRGQADPEDRQGLGRGAPHGPGGVRQLEHFST